MKTLKDANVGETVTVKKIEGKSPFKRRIMDMGITKGINIIVCRAAPLGDPIEIAVRNYRLSIRKSDAAIIQTEE